MLPLSLCVVLGIILAPTLAGVSNCRFPGAPAHSSVFFSNTSLAVGTVATYACERGFELLGPARRVCGADGQWTPEGIPFCVLNVAAGKAPMQISSEQGGVPQKAIDGSTSSFFNAETCTLTRPERVPWWYVNLLEPYMVQLVRLDFGKACCGKNKPATIVVRVGNNRPDLGTNPICNRFTGFLEEGKPLFLPCNPPMPGAFVSVHLEGAPGPSQLSICEAFVYTDQALPIERCPQFRDQPPGSTATYNGKCYIFYNRQPLNLREALAFCRSRGGSLVDESNPALQGFISWELWRRHRSDTSSQYWMGAVRDPQDRNNWKWLGGDDVTVSFWNLPGGNEDCARYDGAKGWLWSDTNCNVKINYICQHQPKACGKPEQPPNSTMVAKNFNVGATIDYSCDEGHLLVGPSTRVCLPTGFYNEFPPVCKRVQCGYPADIPNGNYQLLNDSVGYMSQVLYSCDEGYKLMGRAQLICDLDERWDGPPPRCHQIKQSTPIVPLVTAPKPRTTTRLPPTREKPRPFSPRPTTPATEDDSKQSESGRVPQIVVASAHPQDNEIPDSVHVHNNLLHNGADLPTHSTDDRRETFGAKLNLGAIIALGVFGAFVFLAAVVTTVVILIRRNRSAKHYRHRASPDCNTVASFDSSSSESRGGLNRYYRQAWENLHQSASTKAAAAHHPPLRRKETLDREGVRDGSELVVSDVYPQQRNTTDKKRHHHHHHHSHQGGEWRSQHHQHARSPHKTRY
ncbi:uncharacterized protein LOC124358766 isoform X4 [Homalodisca vitripennis]|uniref:uncharacterized protein LOC124358766 isoform X4 n=1 Tax=Homalodisca vitripennis TaxID=197043 RepID=UPI001EEB2B0B|nr:uncharacterized protein LOC124358766 isoform X4 [Homalodisca vitripennis]